MRKVHPRNRPHAARRPRRRPGESARPRKRSNEPARPRKFPSETLGSPWSQESFANRSTDTKTTSLCRARAQTAEEKLLVYIRPFGFQTEKVDAGHQAHLTADGEIRKRGEKAILRQKKKLLEYKPVTPTPPSFIYLKNSISLKGLTPGDYDLTIILHDQIAKGAPASQIIKFKVIPPKYPPKEKEPTQPHVLDSLYAPFLDVFEPDNDDDN